MVFIEIDAPNNIFEEYLDLKKKTVLPNPPSTDYIRIYADSTGDLFLTKSDGSVVSLTGSNETYSNAGTAGVGIVLTKVGSDFPFKAINGGLSGTVSITDDPTDKTVDIDVVDASEAQKGAVLLGNSGHSSAGRVVQTNDARLTDSRNPLAHAATHSDASTDPVDVTNLAGYPGGSTNFLREDGTFAAPPGASGGEANTSSNAGTGGIGITLAKSGLDLPFKSIAAASTKVTIADDAVNKNVDIDIAEANMDIANMTGSIGDARISDLAYSKLTSVPSTFAPTTHKDAHKTGGSDAFVKGDDLVASAMYVQDVADPASDAQRVWLEDGGDDIRYWSDEVTPVKHSVATDTNTLTIASKTVDSINNTLKNLGSPAYEVFTDATNWYARNIKTGVITSTDTSLTVVLQAAINALTAGRTSKETVKVKGSGSIAKITIPSYTTLDLRDAKLTLIAMTQDHMFVNSDTVGGNTQIDIIGGYLDGNNDGGQGTLGTGDEDLKNIIHLQNVNDSFVLYTYITDTVCRAVRLLDSNNIVVAYNTINDTGAEGIQTKGGLSNKILYNDLRSTRYSWITTYLTPNTLIHGNYCDTVVHDATSGFNISSLRTIVSENRLYNNGNSTISLSESTSTYECSGSRFINNYIHGSRFGGGIIGVGYVFKDLIIAGNEVYDCALAGIRLSGQHTGVVIANNIVHDCQYSGINVGGTASTSNDPRKILIIGNICYNNGKGLGTDVERSGITIFGTDAAGIIDTIITNNICYDTQGTKTQKYGIRAVNSDNCIINNNMVRGNLTDGMILTTNTNLIHHSNKGYASDLTMAFTTTANSFSALQSYRDNLWRVWDPSVDNTYTLQTSELSANVDITLPALGASDEFVFKDHPVTLAGKTLTAPVINAATLSGIFTLPTGGTAITLSKPQGGQEIFWDMTVDDASGSRIRFQNDTGGAGLFVPAIQFRQLSTNAGLTAGKFQGEILDTSDTGAVAVFRIDGRIGSPAGAALVNRPMFDLANFGGQRVAFFNNKITLGVEGGTPQAVDIEIANTTTGTKIGTATTQKIAFHNATPVAQAAFIASPTADLTSLKTAVDAIRTLLINKGLMAPS